MKDAKTYGSGSPGDLSSSFRERERRNVDFDKPTDRQQLRDSLSDEEWAKVKAAEPGGGGGPNSKYFGGAKKPDPFHLFGIDLFGDEIKPDVKGKLRERFDFPPFSVLNAREGPWQERKRAWLSVGMQSELGRGATPETITPKAEGMSGASAGLVALRQQQKQARIDASPGGSARPAMDYSNHERGDGAGRAIVSNTSSSSNAMKYAGGYEDSAGGSSGTSIFDPVLTELCYRWFCPPNGMILDPFAGGSVRGIVAGLLGFCYHGIDLRPEQIHANEVQRNDIAPDADISWHVGDSNILLTDAPDADFVFSCPPYGDLEQYSDNPNDLSTMTWDQFCAMYRSIIQKAIARLKPNRFACFVVGEYRDKKTGLYRGFVPMTCNAFVDAGAALYNEAILITAVGSLPIRITKQFDASRKLGKTHQNVLIFCKGDPRLACEAIKAGAGAPQAVPVRPATVSLAPPPDAPMARPSSAPARLSAFAFAFRPATPAAEPLPAAPSVPPAPDAQPAYREESPDVLQGPSVLDFLSAVARPEPLAQSEAQPPNPSPVLPAPGPSLAALELKTALEARGHRLLTRDGKFFVSEASRLTAEDRAALKEHRAALIQLAEPWKEELSQPEQPTAPAVDRALMALVSSDGVAAQADSLFAEHRPSQTLAQFLGNAQPERSWTPDEPPSLDGIDEVILNFATTGLDWLAGHRPVGVTVSTLDGQLTRFLPFAFAGGNLDEATVKRWAERELRGKKITNAKTKFDVHHARAWGVDLEAQGCTFSDIQHTAALLDDHRKRFALDVLDADYFPDQPKMARVDESRHSEYHAADVAEREIYTARLVGRLRDAMYPEIDKQELRQVQLLEDAVIPAVVEMERNGSPIDMELLERYGRECNAAHDALMTEISQEVGFAFEHTASGWKRLIESLNLPVPDSFAEQMLNEVDHPIVRKGQRAAQYASLNSKIFKAYPEHIRDGILRYGINQLASDEGGTVSGRFSIGLVQQVPNEYNHRDAFGDELFPRRLFIPGAGSYLEADAAQIEFRLLVHYSGNARLIQAYREDPRMSFHKQMHKMLLVHKPDMNYSHVKNYNFASSYGARSIKLAVMMGFIKERDGDEIRAAKRWNDPRLTLIHEIEAAYKKVHPEANALLDRAAHLAKPKCDKYCRQGDALHRQFEHRGYVKTHLGRRSRFPTSYKTYIGLNRVAQGTGADLMKMKIVELHAMRRDTGFVMRITNHDAVLGDALAPDTLTKVSEVLNRQSVELKVPILWECGQGPTWADCKS